MNTEADKLLESPKITTLLKQLRDEFYKLQESNERWWTELQKKPSLVDRVLVFAISKHQLHDVFRQAYVKIVIDHLSNQSLSMVDDTVGDIDEMCQQLIRGAIGKLDKESAGVPITGIERDFALIRLMEAQRLSEELRQHLE